MTVYYNENDPAVAAWLRELIAADLIAPGDVDERSIEDVTPADVTGYRQCHFFAGIGGWSYALRLAGWPDDRPVWTGSCPCQPFSQAGARSGTDDPRHLWPVWRWLVDQCRPAIVFGEQVASKDGRAWLAGVFADLEAMAYRRAGADLCAAGVGAPHIRQRLWWMACTASRDAGAERQQRSREYGLQSHCAGVAGGLGNTQSHDERRHTLSGQNRQGLSAGGSGGAGRLGDTDHPGPQERFGRPDEPPAPARRQDAKRPAGLSGVPGWRGVYIPCADGKARRIEPGIEPLVNGLPGRVGLLRGYGNAIVPELAAAFIEAADYCRK